MMIIVFGATGFVGRNLTAKLAASGHEVVAVSRMGSAAPGAARNLAMNDLGAFRPSDGAVVCHVAAHRYDAAAFSMAQSDILAANVALTSQIYEFCARSGVKEVRMASSVAVYPAGLPLMDDAAPVDLNAAPHPNEAFYAWSKRWGEITAGLYAERYGVATVAFRLSNPYGPFDAVDPAAAHVLPAFVMRALEPGDRFALRGDPYVERDFIYVQDVVEVFEKSLAWRGRNDAFNLCRGETTTLYDLAHAVLRAAGARKTIETEADFAPAAVRVRRSANRRVREAFGLESFTSLDDGLKATADWYRGALHA